MTDFNSKIMFATMKSKPNYNCFPDVETADDDGFLGYSLDIRTEMLLEAYTRAIFPWPVDEKHVLWFSPPQRAVLFFDKFRIPETTLRELKKKNFTFSVNQHFEAVIKNCAASKRKDGGTWITPKMIEAYTKFHQQGYAWSFEVLDADGKLCGGLYGVLIGRFFAGESMFYTASGASKFALINTVDWLQKNRDSDWLDSQVSNPFMQSFGTVEIPRREYTKLLKQTLTT